MPWGGMRASGRVLLANVYPIVLLPRLPLPQQVPSYPDKKRYPTRKKTALIVGVNVANQLSLYMPAFLEKGIIRAYLALPLTKLPIRLF